MSDSALQKNIWVTPEQWNRIAAAVENRDMTANQFLVEFAMEALDRREWARTELEIQLLRSCMFAAQAIARDMEAAGRDDEIEEIKRDISEVAPELPNESDKAVRDRADPAGGDA